MSFTRSLVIALVLAGCVGPIPLKNEPAPDFFLTDTQGEAQDLQKYNGTTLILDLFATWCLPCREQMQSLKTVQAAHWSDVRVLTIATDPTETPDELRAFEVKYGDGWPIVQDNLSLGPALGIHYLPGVAIISPSQRLVYVHEGTAIPSAQIEGVLRRVP